MSGIILHIQCASLQAKINYNFPAPFLPSFQAELDLKLAFFSQFGYSIHTDIASGGLSINIAYTFEG